MSAALGAPATSLTASAAPSAVLPARIVDVELSTPLSAITAQGAAGTSYREAWVLARLFGEPICLLPIPFHGRPISPSRVLEAIERGHAASIRERVEAAGGDPQSVWRGAGTPTAVDPGFLARHQRWIDDGPQITAVICTRNRAKDLRRALRSLAQQTYGRFDVLVVDNAPSDDSTRELVREFAAAEDQTLTVRYAREPRPGLSWARNRALELVTSPVIAWLDDDEVADPLWLGEIAGGFIEHPDGAAVSGSVVPAQLDTQAQLWFEQYGGHTKGRGFEPAVFRGNDPAGQSPVYPLPAFGAGANMAFAVDALRAVGGFDTALGAGTGTLGGEDTLMFSQLLLAGRTVVYRPSAMTRHYHRSGYDDLCKQMRGYGIGLTAYYTSLLRHDWRLAGRLARLAPRALRDTFGSSGSGMASVPDDFPRELLRAKTRGMLAGPWAYARARRAARRLMRARG